LNSGFNCPAPFLVSVHARQFHTSCYMDKWAKVVALLCTVFCLLPAHAGLLLHSLALMCAARGFASSPSAGCPTHALAAMFGSSQWSMSPGSIQPLVFGVNNPSPLPSQLQPSQQQQYQQLPPGGSTQMEM